MFQWELEEREIEVIMEDLVLSNGRKKSIFLRALFGIYNVASQFGCHAYREECSS